jgi:hypothetical protein
VTARVAVPLPDGEVDRVASASDAPPPEGDIGRPVTATGAADGRRAVRRADWRLVAGGSGPNEGQPRGRPVPMRGAA